MERERNGHMDLKGSGGDSFWVVRPIGWCENVTSSVYQREVVGGWQEAGDDVEHRRRREEVGGHDAIAPADVGYRLREDGEGEDHEQVCASGARDREAGTSNNHRDGVKLYCAVRASLLFGRRVRSESRYAQSGRMIL